MFHVNNFALSLPTTRSSDTSMDPCSRTALTALPSRLPALHSLRLQACDHLSKQGAPSIYVARLQAGLSGAIESKFCRTVFVDVSAKVGRNEPGTNCGDEFRPPSEAERLPDNVTRGVNSSFLDSPITGRQTAARGSDTRLTTMLRIHCELLRTAFPSFCCTANPPIRPIFQACAQEEG